ncbi:hypothetical protein CJD36_021195 [Flavipsychrobacter stenotrophus]|uniref:DUF4345 domain-containing protein n=1 Tax=Flavipsychrobacter stenotrophus TaxID=2077091 RepID=A0A2S7SQA7_9BACT|nr:hypothetical protein [Flavipsychrobacter stenotrophus]PQJ09092.1 hypothetical protein CJD36_021195 [Flavipsychrobacter stenotrophus]
MIAIRLVYLANIVVAGWIGICSLFFPKLPSATILQNVYPSTEVIRLVGALWLAIALLSLLGLWLPISFSPVLLLQLIYKAAWLLVVAVPAIKKEEAFPTGMASFFLVWVLVLPFVIPWSYWVK